VCERQSEIAAYILVDAIDAATTTGVEVLRHRRGVV